MRYYLLKGLIFSTIVFSCENNVFSQIRNLTWKNSAFREGQKFPFAYINDSTSIEKNINTYLIDKYLNQSESYRDEFFDYDIIHPTTNICGISITYEHVFNTSPGLWSFTDYNYFDLRDGKIIYVKSLIEEEKYRAFLKIANERKNTFVQDFKKSIAQDHEDFEQLNEIINYTLHESIDFYIDNLNFQHAASGDYKLLLYSDYLELNYYWEYGWGLGQISLPNIILKFTYQELFPLFNDYAKGLLIQTKTINK